MIYDPDGIPIGTSLRAAAERLGCSPETIHNISAPVPGTRRDRQLLRLPRGTGQRGPCKAPRARWVEGVGYVR
jgi:hypothetical protein